MEENKVLEGIFGESKLSLGYFIEDSGLGNIKNLGLVESAARQIEGMSQDYFVKRGDLNFEFDGSLWLQNSFMEDSWKMSNWSLGQVCSVLDVPARYVKKCLSEGNPDLASHNLNSWLKKDQLDKEYLIRTTNNRVHGFLSKSYSVFDDVGIIESLKETLTDDEYTIKNYCIDPEYFNIRIVKKGFLNIDGEDLSVGFNIKNSRVGRSMVNVQILIYKWMCSNGIILGGGMGTLYARKHVGFSPEIFKKEFKDNLVRVPEIVAAVKAWVEGSAKNKLNNYSLQKIIDDMKAKEFSELLTGKIKDAVPENPTKWDVVNTITRLAQNYSLEMRERMETYAGYLLAA